jgi:hypothetical protein
MNPIFEDSKLTQLNSEAVNLESNSDRIFMANLFFYLLHLPHNNITLKLKPKPRNL